MSDKPERLPIPLPPPTEEAVRAYHVALEGDVKAPPKVEHFNRTEAPQGYVHHINESDEQRQCRFCLEEDGEMIAPCLCKGSTKWVHRECLDL